MSLWLAIMAQCLTQQRYTKKESVVPPMVKVIAYSQDSEQTSRNLYYRQNRESHIRIGG